MEEEDNIIVKWAQEDVETLDNLLNNKILCGLRDEDFPYLTLITLMWRIGCAHNNARK